jgi:soluble lytic murein transglycosylase
VLDNATGPAPKHSLGSLVDRAAKPSLGSLHIGPAPKPSLGSLVDRAPKPSLGSLHIGPAPKPSLGSPTLPRHFGVANALMLTCLLSQLHSSPAAAQSSDRNAAIKSLGEAYRQYDAGNVDGATAAIKSLTGPQVGLLLNKDYALWLQGQIALVTGQGAVAYALFEKLAQVSGSRFSAIVPWRLADSNWVMGKRQEAAKAYEILVATKNADSNADVPVAMWRIAQMATTKQWHRRLILEYPAHPVAAEALSALQISKAPEAFLSAADHIVRAQQMSNARAWDDAVAELEMLDVSKMSAKDRTDRDYWLGTTLYKMRRRYAEAGDLLLKVSGKMGKSAAESMFHGARALSRADRDDDAIKWYREVVRKFPASDWAKEAQFLTGWLEFNRGNYKQAIAPLEVSIDKNPKSKWMDDSLWFLGMSQYLLGNYKAAKVQLTALSKRGGSLEGGKGQYWLARTEEKLGNDSKPEYNDIVRRYPFSWYAMLARARLKQAGADSGSPFGAKIAPRGPQIDDTPDPALATDPLVAKADELITAGLLTEAGEELARGETGFIKRHGKAKALAMLFDRYHQASNFNRPWMLSIIHGASALNTPPQADAKIWWQSAYPRAFHDLVSKHQALGNNPDDYLVSIMRKESGFNPHDISYADAQGLLQMIPATTRRTCTALNIQYADGRLYETEFNIQTGSWYIGNMLNKFKRQIPIGAGSFNSGPRPVMKWLEQNGNREMDEFVELVPYTQTREYMKKVTENYARYRYLYASEDYEQTLVVDKDYMKNSLTY